MSSATEDPRGEARAVYADLDDGELASWALVEQMHDWAALLLGNGASRAVWDGFAYNSLYDEASSTGAMHPLAEADEALFDALGTTNFEGVLAALKQAKIVDDALGLDTQEHEARYESVREALVSAVHAVHVPWTEVQPVLGDIKRALLDYDYVFTTNYDLLAYWAAMNDEPRINVPDYFWSQPLVFDPLNTEVWGKATKLLFLHGGLHLYRLSDGRTFKRKAEIARNLLDLFAEPLDLDKDAVPLFVSEGEAEDKLHAIRTSEYLTFALSEFADLRGPLVVFGHSLSRQDEHLVSLVRKHRGPLAISMLGRDTDDTRAHKDDLRARLRTQDVLFFDATTHPLGHPGLKVASS